MKVSIMQPTFNPWIGYFDLIDYCDTFVFLDTVQLAKRSWQVRNKLKINNLEYMFSIPLKKEISRDNEILKNIKISYSQYDFRNKLFDLIKRNYKKAKYYDELINKLEKIITFDSKYLVEYNINFIESISILLGYKTKFILSSQIDYQDSVKGQLIFNICDKLNTTEYISPLGSKEYLNKELDIFYNNNIKIFYQNYIHKEYSQLGIEFIPYLGITDILLNEGIENTKKIIRNGRNYKEEIK